MEAASFGRSKRFTWYNGVALALALIWTLFPIYWMVNFSLKPWYETYAMRDVKERVPTPSAVEMPESTRKYVPIWFPDNPTIENYTNVFVAYVNPMGNSQPSSWRSLVTSSIIGGVSTIVSIALGLMAAFAISRYRTGGYSLPFYILSFRMIPAIVIAIPFTYVASQLGPNLTPVLITLIYVAYTAPVATWMLKSFVEQVPIQLEEAAMIDGMSRWRAHFQITVPLMKGGLVATILFVFILNWTEGQIALALMSGRFITVPAQIIDRVSSPNVQAALAVIAAIPPVLVGIFIRQHLGRAFTFGAIKG